MKKTKHVSVVTFALMLILSVSTFSVKADSANEIPQASASIVTTIYAKDAVIYAEDYAPSKFYDPCLGATPDAEALRLMAMIDGVYGWDADNKSISHLIRIVDDGGFTLEKVGGGLEASFTISYAAIDGNGEELAVASRTITVYQFMRLSPSALWSNAFGGDAIEGSLRFYIDTAGGMRGGVLDVDHSLRKNISGIWTGNYCSPPHMKWMVGTAGYHSGSGLWLSGGVDLGTATPKDVSMDGPVQTATLEWEHPWGGGHITFRWIVTYERSADIFSHEWEMINHTGAPLEDVRLYYGGHHTLGGGAESGWTDYDENNFEISGWKDTANGVSIFRSTGPEAPSYYDTRYYESTPMIAIGENLGNYTRPVGEGFHTAYYMQWDTAAVPDGDSWTVNAEEGIINPGELAIIPQTSKTVPPNITVTYEFTVRNLTNESFNADLSVVSSNAWSASIEGSNTLHMTPLGSTNSRQTVRVNLAIPDDAADGAMDTLTLAATSPSYSASGSVTTYIDSSKILAVTVRYDKNHTDNNVTHPWTEDPIKTKTLAVGSPYILPAAPTRTGYTFAGWFTVSANTGGAEVTGATIVTNLSNHTLYARWNAISDGSSGDSGSTFKPTGSEPAASVPAPMAQKRHAPYINGYSDGSVRPDTNITRAEMAIILWRLLSAEKAVDAETAPFTDVPANAWYAQSVNRLSELGILKGYPDGAFRPNSFMTREEFVAVVCRYFNTALEGGGNPFHDVVSGWAFDYIITASSLDWINGYSDGSFRPYANITRAEAVTILNRILDRTLLQQNVPNKYHRFYIDLSSDHWAFQDMIEASVEHSYTIDDETEAWDQ